MVRFLLTMNLEFIDQGNLKVYMNLGKATAYFVQLAEMMAPMRATWFHDIIGTIDIVHTRTVG